MNILIKCMSILITAPWLCSSQSDVLFPLTLEGIGPIIRGKIPVPPGRKARFSDVIVRHYGGQNTSETTFKLSNLHQVLESPGFDVQRPTVLYSHGYVELVTDESVVTVVTAYQEADSHNLLVLDWSNLAYGNYIVSALGVAELGQQVGRALHHLVKAGLPLTSLHLVGHSLGSHLSSGIAKYMASKDMKLPRVSGLDPALPGFYPLVLGPRISADDADFVDIIHTDSSFYGTPQTTGHADFWPNGGTAKQPGCIPATIFLTAEYLCSHYRSWRLWAESVRGGDFKARPCSDYDTFLRGGCGEGALVEMGSRADVKLRGHFYLRTAAKTPYALGERGAS